MKDELYLVDTSVWLEVLPPGRGHSGLRDRVDGLLASDMAATTGMVRLELLGGARNEADFRRLGELLSGLHLLPVAEERWSEAAQMGFVARRRGITVPFTDLLIAAVAQHAGAILVHRDHHFDLIASQVELRVESYVIVQG